MSKQLSSVPNREQVDKLVRRAKAGEEQARSDLFRLTVPMVWRLLSRFVSHRTDVEDLVQTVFIECFRSLPSFRGESAFTTWLGSICVRVAMAHKKRAYREQHEPLYLSVVSDQGPEQHALERERAQALEQVLERLSPTLRVPFVLHVIEAFDIETVAAMTQSSVAATYKAVERARERIEKSAEKNPLLRPYLHGGEA